MDCLLTAVHAVANILNIITLKVDQEHLTYTVEHLGGYLPMTFEKHDENSNCQYIRVRYQIFLEELFKFVH